MADLEKRVRRIERNYIRDAHKVATHVARVEIVAHEGAWHDERASILPPGISWQRREAKDA